jgi:hypothetical protein
MKDGHGKRYSRGCPPWSAFVVHSSSTPPALSRQPPLGPHPHLPIGQSQREPSREAKHVERRDDPCQSLFTFQALCANLLLDGLESRSRALPQLWPTPCPLFGHSTRAFEIALQRSKDKCGSISIFSLGTKMSDTQAGSRVASPPDRRFPSCLQLAVAERIPVISKRQARRPGLRGWK